MVDYSPWLVGRCHHGRTETNAPGEKGEGNKMGCCHFGRQIKQLMCKPRRAATKSYNYNTPLTMCLMHMTMGMWPWSSQEEVCVARNITFEIAIIRKQEGGEGRWG